MHETAFWEAITKNEYQVPEGETAVELLPELIGFLASPDPVVRDGFGYMILAHWMVGGVLTDEELTGMIEPLTKGMHADSIFERSFSALMLGYVVNEDNKREFLDAAGVHAILKEALAYFAREEDLRGYLSAEEGWAHSVAHTADLLWQVGKSRHLSPEQRQSVLQAIHDKLTVKTTSLLVHSEDERLARAVMGIVIQKDVPPEMLTEWVTGMADAVLALEHPSGEFDPAIHGAYFNTRNLLRSVYFYPNKLEDRPANADALQEAIREALKRFNF